MSKIFPWVCPKCEKENLGQLPMNPPGTECSNCGFVYYLGKITDEEIEIVSRQETEIMNKFGPEAINGFSGFPADEMEERKNGF